MIEITYFVHGTTTDNEKNLATGWLPGKLSRLGQNQSSELGKIIKIQNFDAVFCSDLKRAVETAQIMFGKSGLILKDKRLREINYGDFNGKPNIFKDKMYDYVEKSFPNGESYYDVEVRIRDFCNYLKENFGNKKIAVIAHQAPQLALEVILNGKSWRQAIDQDWRKTNTYQPGWKYRIDQF
jgi:broad specificity phosphatase PhoE